MSNWKRNTIKLWMSTNNTKIKHRENLKNIKLTSTNLQKIYGKSKETECSARTKLTKPFSFATPSSAAAPKTTITPLAMATLRNR